MSESKLAANYKQVLEQEKRSDYYQFFPMNGKVNGIYNDSKGWEFRFAIKPTKENLDKAINAALSVLLPEGLGENEEPAFKFMQYNDPTKPSAKITGHEGPYVIFSNNSDRDQRTKEFVISMREKNGTNDFEKSPDEFKELILKLWRAFIDHGVEIGYMSPQIGDKALSAESGLVTPVSYTCANKNWSDITKPFWNEIQGMDMPLTGDVSGKGSVPFDLTETLYTKLESKKAQDPLEGLHISRNDLMRHGIPLQKVIEMQANKISYLQTHYTQAVVDIAADLEQQKSVNITEDLVRESLQRFKALVGETKESTENQVVDAQGWVTDAGLSLVCGDEEVFQSLRNLINEAQTSDGLVDLDKLNKLAEKAEHLKILITNATERLETGRVVKKDSLMTGLGKEAFLRKFAEYRSDVENISRFFPRTNGTGGSAGALVSPGEIDKLYSILGRDKGACGGDLIQKFKTEFLPPVEKLFERATVIDESTGLSQVAAERKNIFTTFANDKNILVFLNQNGIDDAKLKDMIANDPGAMQLFYRRLRELKKERFFLFQERYRLQQMIGVYSPAVLIDLFTKESSFGGLQKKIFLSTFLVLVIGTPLSSAIAIYGFGKLPENLTHNLVEGDSLADHFKTFGLNAVEGLLLTALIGFIIYKSVRYSYDKQLIEAIERKDSKEVTALIAKGADPELIIPGTPAQTLLQKAVAGKDEATVGALLENPANSKWFSGAFFGLSEVKSVVRKEDDAEFLTNSL